MRNIKIFVSYKILSCQCVIRLYCYANFFNIFHEESENNLSSRCPMGKITYNLCDMD